MGKMDKDKLNQILSLSGNAAVLLGIVVLIYELQQNNVIAKAQMRSEISQSAINNIGMAQTPEGMAISEKLQLGEGLTPGERTWVSSGYRKEFRAWENVHYQYRVGLYEENEMDSYRVFWQGRANGCDPLYADFYFDNRIQFEPNFRGEMDSIFNNANCTAPESD